MAFDIADFEFRKPLILLQNGSLGFGKFAVRLQQEFGEKYVPILFDVTDEAAVRLRRIG